MCIALVLTSSVANMTEEGLGKPIIDCVLEAGDLLYFPRGAIHQAMAQEDEHSLHITISTQQKNSWSDLLNLVSTSASLTLISFLFSLLYCE